MKRQFLKSRKGILLTLVTIVLFLLMLSELITYVTFSINYDSLSTASSTTFSSSAFAATLTSQSAAWLHSSLYNALGALVGYEGNPSQRDGNFINNTALALKSLVTNGTIYGTNLNSTMGGATLKVWLNYTKLAGLSQNVNVSIKNSSIIIFQGGPFSLNATLTGLMIINSTYGVSTYPLSVTVGIPLNGTVSVYSAETADTSPIKAQSSYPVAQLVGNTYAVKGSTSPFMSAYGTVASFTGTLGCASIPAAVQNKNFIIVEANAYNLPQNACGAAGVVTYSNTPGIGSFLVPWLGYSPSTNIVNILQNGTSVLLDGKGLALYNLSQIQNAVQNGYAYPSSYVPSFLDQGQGSLTNRNPNGMFSFAYEGRQSAAFIGSNYISTGNTGFPLGNSNKAVFAWIYPTTEASQQMIESFGSGSSNLLASLILRAGGDVTFTTDALWAVQSSFVPPLNAWSFVGYTYNGVTRSTTIYFNGQSFTGTLGGSLAVDTAQAYIGRFSGGQYWNGKIADVQVYNGTLNPAQAYQLYQEGIGGAPIVNANLTGWWPLNGNGNDYSSRGNNGNIVNVGWSGIPNYNGNPLLQGSLYNSSTNNKIYGVLNCGTLNQCANSSLQHLYLGALALKGNTSVQGALFNGQTAYITTPPVMAPASHTIEFWMKTFTTQTSPIQSMISLWGSYNARIAIYGSGSGISFNRDGGGSIASGVTPNANQWYQVAVVLSSSKVASIYVNGVLRSTGVAPSQTESWSIEDIIGSDVSPPTTPFNGLISNVQFYNSALSSAQITALYANGINNKPIVPSNTIGWWPLNGTINDYSGLSENGVNYGAAFVTSYTNQTNGTSTEAQAFHLGDAVVPNVANFNGISTSNIVIAKDTSWPAGSQAVSIFAWVRSTQSASYPFIVQYGRYNTAYQDWLLGDYSGQICADDWGDGVACGPSITDGKWHFVGLTYAGGGTTAVTTYTDGVATSSNFCASCVPNVYTGSGSVAAIGSGCCGGFFNGSVADVHIYNVSLSQAQVYQLYSNDSVVGLGPVAWFPLSMSVNGLMNETPNLAFPNNPGYFGSCTSSNAIYGNCGVKEVQP